jgi:hypothetical protein
MLQGRPVTGTFEGLGVHGDCVRHGGRPHRIQEPVRDGFTVVLVAVAPVIGLAIANALPQFR